MGGIKSNEKPERATTDNKKQRKAAKSNEEQQKAKTGVVAGKTKTGNERPNRNQALLATFMLLRNEIGNTIYLKFSKSPQLGN